MSPSEDGHWFGVCGSCGEVTEKGDDPAPDLCQPCLDAGRGRGDVRTA